MMMVSLNQKFNALSNKQIALLIFIIVFSILYTFRMPYVVEGDTVFYATRTELFVEDWDSFVIKALAMVKHILYLLALGVLKTFTPFLSTQGTITLFSTFFSSLSISLTYLLSEKIFKDRNIALLSAALFFSTRMFLYFTLLGEQYTFQAFFTLVTLLLIYEDRYAWAGVVLGISLIASPSTGYYIFGFMYLIWKRSKSWKALATIWVIPTAIFAPVLIGLGRHYSKNVGWTMASAWYHIVYGEVFTGAKVVASKLVDNFVLFLPFIALGLYLAYKKDNKTYREIVYLFLLSVVPITPLIIIGGVGKWYLPMMPFFVLCATIPFKESKKLRKLFPLLAIINLLIFSSMLLVPLYKESVSQHDIFTSGEMPWPIIMRWSSGTFYEYYANGRFYEILTVETTTIEDPVIGWYSLEGIFRDHGKVYLYDYTEIQCRPITSLYGVYLTIVEGDQTFTVMDRINRKFDVNYSIYKEFDDGTIIWELTPK